MVAKSAGPAAVFESIEVVVKFIAKPMGYKEIGHL